GRAPGAVEPFEPQPVREEARNRSLQRVETGERVLAHADQDVHAQAAALQDACELLCELAAAAVVQEELLELIEDHVEIAAGPIGGMGERAREVTAHPPRRVDERGDRVSPPTGEDQCLRLSLLPEPVRDACPEDRALPNAARSVQDRDPRGDQVRRDDLALPFASEEEKRVGVRVLERRKALVGRRKGRDGDAHAATSAPIPACAASNSTYRSSGSSCTSTSRRRQNSRSSGLASGCTAHDR